MHKIFFQYIKHLITFAAMFKTIRNILVFILILSVTACSNFNKVMKDGTPDEKYEAAENYFKKGDYYHALSLYEELIVLYRGNAKIKPLYYNYAYAHYYEKDYVLASYHFKYYAKTFPNDSLSEEAMYMSAYCKYHISPKTNLDQSSTLAAIQEMQNFVNQYPNSPKVEEANKIMDGLRAKLIEKDYNIAKLYLNTEYYKAAISSLAQHIKDYPSTPYKEDCLYNIIEANYQYAKKSVLNKQVERYTNAIGAYNDYVSKFPQGKHLKDAMKLMKASQMSIKKINNKSNK